MQYTDIEPNTKSYMYFSIKEIKNIVKVLWTKFEKKKNSEESIISLLPKQHDLEKLKTEVKSK